MKVKNTKTTGLSVRMYIGAYQVLSPIITRLTFGSAHIIAKEQVIP
jgi:hypothetical protein